MCTMWNWNVVHMCNVHICSPESWVCVPVASELAAWWRCWLHCRSACQRSPRVWGRQVAKLYKGREWHIEYTLALGLWQWIAGSISQHLHNFCWIYYKDKLFNAHLSKNKFILHYRDLGVFSAILVVRIAIKLKWQIFVCIKGHASTPIMGTIHHIIITIG